MEYDFQPTYAEKDKNDFNTWDLGKKPVNDEPEIDAQELFEQECESIRQRTHQEAYEQGLLAAEEEINALKTRFNEWFSTIQNPIKLLDKQLSDEVLQTILWICHECIKVELSLHPEKILAVIEAIKPELNAIKQPKKLCMHPDDISWLKQHLDNSMDDWDTLLIEDERLQRGDMYLHSEHHVVDGKIYNRLQKICAQYFNFPNPNETMEDA